jgi:hypothetical protein
MASEQQHAGECGARGARKSRQDDCTADAPETMVWAFQRPGTARTLPTIMPQFRALLACLNGLVLGLCLLVPSVALAAAKDKAASQMRREAMQTDYAATNFKKAEQKLKKAIAQCGASGCSNQVVGELHRDLATVYIAGLKQNAKGKAEFKHALQANPDLELDDDYATVETRKVYAELGGRGAKPAADEKSNQSKKGDPHCESGSDGCFEAALESGGASAADNDKGAKNWLSLHFQQDLLLFTAQDQVCPPNATGPGAPNYSCFGGSAGQDIAPGPGNSVSGGLGRATSRLLLGFDRLLSANLSLGLRLGYAFGGRPPSADKFWPFHLELRGNYWFGKAPFERSGLRPYLSLAGGLAEVDSKVVVEYYNPAGTKGTFDAWRKTGKGFAALGFGVLVPFAGDNGIVPELRVMQMFGASGTVFDVSIGYARGF